MSQAAQMLFQVLARGGGVSRIDPFHLRETLQRVAQMRDVDSAASIVMRKMPHPVSAWRRLDSSEGGIRQRIDVPARPLSGLCRLTEKQNRRNSSAEAVRAPT
ncbi:MAG: hypothetical protein ACHQ9S_18370 [Candidatus Binatia bacterium]